ncbi:hypothetical protein [Glycomyces albidus]|uniref:Uncharacterized protein n=1 Tax=Glycomyces albidus TaxID=2656774 RepID=A0A6L5G6I1_9ACTN|nr:hypothetical protein [Glycomyces albidus]MQM25246.1 hypothetical protein [Glycomyces albidus]
MSRASRHIRVTGKRRDVIDTDRLAALLLRVALRRIADNDTDQATAGPAAPDSHADDVEGEAAT